MGTNLGFFEFIDLASALGIPSVVSTFAEVSAQSCARRYLTYVSTCCSSFKTAGVLILSRLAEVHENVSCPVSAHSTKCAYIRQVI